MAVVAWRVVRLRVSVISLFIAAGCVPDERPERTSTSRAASASAAKSAASQASNADARRAPPSQSASAPKLAKPFTDDFERSDLGPDWNLTGSGWSLREGRLCVANARNHPAWLRQRLPTNARIEFDATSSSSNGDLKVEAWGDGSSAATSSSYVNATSYLVIFGGWKNTLHVLARLDEHGKDRRVIQVEPGETDPRAQPVLPDRVYRFKIERADGQTVRYFVDDIEILSLKDANPLLGEGHEHFGFNDWQVAACFDNLTITPLKS